MRPFLLCLCAILALAVGMTDAVSQSYVLQRRVDAVGDWETASTFTISRHSFDSAPKLRFSDGAQGVGREENLTKEKKLALANAEFVYYRIVREGDKDGSSAVSVALSPCSLVRDFDAVDSRTVALREVLRVVVGPNTTVVGLQTTSGTNTFHAKLLNGDECDLGILSLFPHVRMRVSIGLLEPTTPRSLPNYADLDMLGKSGDSKATGSKKRKQKKRGRAGDSPEPYGDQQQTGAAGGRDNNEEEEEEDNRTFLQKYWTFLVIPFAVSLVQGLFANKQ